MKNEPTFCVGNIQTIIDVTLVSRTLLCDVHQWHVSWDEVGQSGIKWDKLAPIWCQNVKRMDWQLYDEELEASISMWLGLIETPADIERELNVLNFAVTKAFHKACPEHRVSSRNKVP